MKWKAGCLLTFVLIIGAPFVASHYLAAWGTLLFIAAEGLLLLWVVPQLVKFAARRLAVNLIAGKSRVLRGAMVEIHRVELTNDPRSSTPLPDQDHSSAENTEQALRRTTPARQRFVMVECTITPSPDSSRMRFWEPDELLLVPFDAKIKMSHDPTADDNAGAIQKCSIFDESGAETEDFDKITGRTRIRAVFKCPPTLIGRAKLRYYFETFGDVMLP